VKKVINLQEINKIRILSILSSSLFYWFYSVFSDGHNFTKTVIGSFPFLQFSDDTDIKLKQLIDDLMIDLEKNAWLKQAFYKTTGKVEYKEYYPKLSKNLIEEITKVICKEYGLNKAEIDFILNYDVKIRNGKSKEEEQD
jgi:phenylpyruvate tautomerase PptA (4-oxalocrotonate tautomerase family)